MYSTSHDSMGSHTHTPNITDESNATVCACIGLRNTNTTQRNTNTHIRNTNTHTRCACIGFWYVLVLGCGIQTQHSEIQTHTHTPLFHFTTYNCQTHLAASWNIRSHGHVSARVTPLSPPAHPPPVQRPQGANVGAPNLQIRYTVGNTQDTPA